MVLKIGVLASGRGSNLQAIIDAVEKGCLKGVAEVSVVVSNKKDALALERARSHGINAVFLDAKGKQRVDYDEEVMRVLKENRVGLVVLAGYFLIVSPEFVNGYRNKILNIHPSLLPAFPGGCSNAQKRALEWGVKVSGCTVHFVDEGEDTGPIILQKAVSVEEGDSEETLSARILEQEHKLLPKAIELIAKERIRVEGRKTLIVWNGIEKP